MKTILSLFILMACVVDVQAQKVQFKDKQVLLDGKPILRYEIEAYFGNKYTFYSLTGNDEVLEIKKVADGASGGAGTGASSGSIYLYQYRMTIEASGFLIGVTPLASIKKLIKEGVLTSDGTLNGDKATQFKAKYVHEAQ